jgi:hypothetical protein
MPVPGAGAAAGLSWGLQFLLALALNAVLLAWCLHDECGPPAAPTSAGQPNPARLD